MAARSTIRAPRDGLWFITQYRRWGMLEGAAADDAAIAAAISQTALYREAAALAGVPLPDEQRRGDSLRRPRVGRQRDPALISPDSTCAPEQA